MPKPNFFIVGAPKCGTTALSDYLRAHPRILMSDPKEPSFFCSDFDLKGRREDTLEDYLDTCFAHGASLEYDAVGEASVWYLYSKIAAKRIMDFDPHARIIVMLRNPADMLQSMYSQYVYQGHEAFQNFGDAWRACNNRRGGQFQSETWLDTKLLLYDEISQFGHQVEALYETIPKDQIFVIFFDDFIYDPQKITKEVLGFLNVPEHKEMSFDQVNSSRYIDNRLLYEISRSRLARGTAGILRRILGVKTLGVGRPAIRISMDERRIVLDHCRNDIARLSSLLNRDLSKWT